MTDASRINIITVSQEYGSDGDKIAAKLAARLRWKLIDNGMIAQIAQQLGVSEEAAALYHEYMPSFLDQVLFFLQFSTAEAVEAWAQLCIAPVSPKQQAQLYHDTLQQIIRKHTQTGNIVMMGHDAQLLLANKPNVLHVRVTTPLEQQIRYTMQYEQLDERRAHAHIQRKNRQLARYLWSHYYSDAGNPLRYDIVVENDRHMFDLENLVDHICLALECKDRALVFA